MICATDTIPPLRLLDQVRAAIRVRGYSPRTEKAYVRWIRRFVRFHGTRHPRDLAEPKVSSFLTHLAVERNVSASAQNQALSAILFLYPTVLKQELDWLNDVVRARRPVRLPVVLTRSEVATILDEMDGTPRLMASLLYGAGLRVLECARLRVKDVDLERREILVRDGKGGKDRVTLLPAALQEPLRTHLAGLRRQHHEDLDHGFGSVELPTAIERKYPRAAWEWGWQWVFPATRFYRDPVTGRRRRHHLHETVLQRAMKEAVRAGGLAKPATCHTLRHSFATPPLEHFYYTPPIPELFVRSDAATTRIYTHVLNRGGRGVRSPLDR
ncbi:integron integrase [soil metagenome]